MIQSETNKSEDDSHVNEDVKELSDDSREETKSLARDKADRYVSKNDSDTLTVSDHDLFTTLKKSVKHDARCDDINMFLESIDKKSPPSANASSENSNESK